MIIKKIFNLCYIYNHICDFIYDAIYGKTYIPKIKFIKPIDNNIYKSHPSHIYIINIIIEYLEKIKVKPTFIVDIGCGHGRAVNKFYREFKCKTIGYEVIADTCIKAIKYNKKLNLKIDNNNVFEKINEINSADFIYMFNPFPTKILIDFLKKLDWSMKRSIILVNYDINSNEFFINNKNFQIKEVPARFCSKKVFIHHIFNYES